MREAVEESIRTPLPTGCGAVSRCPTEGIFSAAFLATFRSRSMTIFPITDGGKGFRSFHRTASDACLALASLLRQPPEGFSNCGREAFCSPLLTC